MRLVLEAVHPGGPRLHPDPAVAVLSRTLEGVRRPALGSTVSQTSRANFALWLPNTKNHGHMSTTTSGVNMQYARYRSGKVGPTNPRMLAPEALFTIGAHRNPPALVICGAPVGVSVRPRRTWGGDSGRPPSASGLPTPEKVKAPAGPDDDARRLDEHPSGTHAGPQPGEVDPEQSVAGLQPGSRDGTLQGGKLVAESDVFRQEGCMV